MGPVKFRFSVGFAVFVLASCSRPLPEEGSAPAVLYRARCGGCHRPYPPSSLKLATWEMILPRMENHMREVGQPLFSAEERAAIRDYLKRNAG